MLKYRCTMVALMVTLSSSAASEYSAVSHSGAWHSVDERTWWSDGSPKGFSLTLNLQFSRNRVVYSSVNDTDKSRPPTGLAFATTLDGVMQSVPDQKKLGYDHVSFQRVGVNEFRMLRMLDGELIAAQFWTFSADGREFVRRGTSRTATGPWHAYEEWFVLQK